MVAEFNDRNKISNKLSTYDTGSEYVAAGLMIMGIIGIVCYITIGWLRTNNDKQDSITLNATRDEQYQKCIKENGHDFEAGNH